MVVKTGNKTIKLNIGAVVLCIFLLITFFLKPDDCSDTTVRALGIMTVAAYGAAIVVWYVNTKKIGSLYFIFLLMCFMFNAGQIILGALNIPFVSNVNIYHSYSNRLLAEMMLFQSKAVLALGIGGGIAYDANAYNFENSDYSNINNELSFDHKIGFWEVAYFAAYALTIVSYLREFVSRSGVSYGEYYYGGNREGISIYLLFIYHVLMFVCFMRHDKDRFSKWLLVCNIFLVFIMLMIGSRNATLQLVFGCLFIYLYIKRNLNDISLKKVLVYVLIGLLLLLIFTGFQDIRQMSFSELSLSKIAEIYSGSIVDGIVESLVQMGGSARCVLQTMQEIQSGNTSSEQTLFYAFARGIIPISILSFFGIDAPSKLSLSAWITEVGGSQSGWGYSIFAEMYYNFQELGWIFGFFFAFAYVKLEQKALKLIKEGRTFFAAALIYVLSYAIFIARADMILITSRMRMCVYVAIISFVMRQMHWKFKSIE